MSKEEGEFSVRVERLDNFRFIIDFGLERSKELITDEPPPLGNSTGPNPSRMLAASIGSCLASSLLFCLQKARAPVKNISAKVYGKLVRNEKGRLRISDFNVEIDAEVGKEYASQTGRCLELFEDFCIVSKSVERGIPYKVKVNWI